MFNLAFNAVKEGQALEDKLDYVGAKSKYEYARVTFLSLLPSIADTRSRGLMEGQIAVMEEAERRVHQAYMLHSALPDAPVASKDPIKADVLDIKDRLTVLKGESLDEEQLQRRFEKLRPKPTVMSDEELQAKWLKLKGEDPAVAAEREERQRKFLQFGGPKLTPAEEEASLLKSALDEVEIEGSGTRSAPVSAYSIPTTASSIPMSEEDEVKLLLKSTLEEVDIEKRNGNFLPTSTAAAAHESRDDNESYSPTFPRRYLSDEDSEGGSGSSENNEEEEEDY